MIIPIGVGSQEFIITALVDNNCKHTKNCTHSINGKVLGKAKWIGITKPDELGSCYLFMCYADGFLSDSVFESLEEAKEQAEWEYEGISINWQNAI